MPPSAGSALAAAGAQAGLEPGLVAPECHDPGIAAAGLDIGAAIELARGPGDGIAVAFGRAPFPDAAVAQPALGRRRGRAAFRAQSGCDALGGLPPAARPLAGARRLRIPAQCTGFPERRIAGAGGLVPPDGAGFADAALRRRRPLAAARAESQGDALGAAPAEALAVAGAAPRGFLVRHGRSPR